MKRSAEDEIFNGDDTTSGEDEASISPPPLKRPNVQTNASSTVVRSPFQLTSIRDLPDSRNKDCVSLHDLLGDPLIREAWLFDFLYDVDFVMAHFDPDVRRSVEVKVVHGSWKREDTNRQRIEEALKRWPNVEAIAAYLSDPFGTHHSKMMILFRHDDSAEVVVHTANMIECDWANFTQAVWKSPRLPALSAESSPDQSALSELGSGLRFKQDLLRYLGAYSQSRTGKLSSQLQAYDFSEIRAVFMASAPSKVNTRELQPGQTPWGWVGLREVLRRGPKHDSSQKPLTVAQVSSVATVTDDWIGNMESVLATPRSALSSKPDLHLIFPTDDEVRRSLDGYGAGSSIHMRTQSPAQQKMLTRLHPHLTHWAGDDLDTADPTKLTTTPKQAGRRRAAPHIKTYMRFSNSRMDKIEYAMLTSANFSKQAWGAMPNKGIVSISSYETGVLVWPALFAPPGEQSKMVPTFQHDTPEPEDIEGTVIGLRMPYDIPLVRYSPNENPWVATANHSTPDWRGSVYQGADP